MLALSKKPEDRFKSTSAFARALETVTSSLPNNANVSNRQRGRDIHTTINISQAEALAGINYTLTLPEGKHVTVLVPAKAYNGQVITLAGQGEPSSTGGPQGDLIVTVTVPNTEAIPFPSSSKQPRKPVSVLKSQISRITSKNKISSSRIKANILLYCVMTGVVGCIAGIVLNAYGVLPSHIANIGSSISGLIALIAGSWTVIEKLFPKRVWQNANRLPVIVISMLTVCILIVVPLWQSFSQTRDTAHYPPSGWSQKLDDPLQNEPTFLWPNDAQADGSCHFTGNGYQITSGQLENIHKCPSSTAWRKWFNGLCHESLSLVGPFERLGHGLIVVVDESQDSGLQVFNGGEGTTFEQFADQNAQPDLNLIQPRTVLGRVMEHDSMGRISQKRGATGH